MSNQNYAFAVAQVRSLENSLLNKSHYEQILSVKTEAEAVEILASRGWQIPENYCSFEEILAKESTNTWELLKGLCENDKNLSVFTLKNDFHNLKTALKAHIANVSGSENYIYPTSFDTGVLTEVFAEKKYDLLPVYLQDAAKEAYDEIMVLADGQTADIILDRRTLEQFLKLAKETNSEIVKQYCEKTVEYTDIKTSFRGAITKKGEEFYKKALCGTDFLQKSALSRAARKGKDELISYLSSCGFVGAAEQLKISLSAFEKYVETELSSVLNEACFVSFGIEPLLAFGFKKETEIKNIRIALTQKKTGADLKETEERMRVDLV